MASITLEQVLDALLLMLGLTIVSVTIVGGLMYWLYRVFKNKQSETKDL